MQMVLPGMENLGLRRLVLMHESDEDGLVRAAIGVLQSATHWAWNVPLFDRYEVDIPVGVSDQAAPYDERPEAELPPIEKRDSLRLDETAER
jgi:hypothetical protein